MERSFVMIKPDGVIRGLIGEIVGRFEKKGFKIIEASLTQPDSHTINSHYIEHKDKDYFNDLVAFIMEGSVMALVIEGENVIEVIRIMVGNKDPRCAMPGTIRGDFANTTTRNIIHASDSIESSNREIGIWFPNSN